MKNDLQISCGTLQQLHIKRFRPFELAPISNKIVDPLQVHE